MSLLRLAELLPKEAFRAAYGASDVQAVPPDNMLRIRLVASLSEALEKWLVNRKLPTLGELVLSGTAADTMFFTYYGPFYCKGAGPAALRHQAGRPPTTIPRMRADLSSFQAGLSLEMQIHPANYTSVSSASEMSGRKRLFVLGRITGITPELISAQAYAVGIFHGEERGDSNLEDPFGRLSTHMEVFVSSIDQFRNAANQSAPTPSELGRLAITPEVDVKTAFAEIVGEAFIPKDWGGERSDLTTTQVSIDGKSVAAAFAFKGKSKPKPMTVADLGKNGDQISRLFTEPVDFVVLQHCHEVTSAVRDHMRAFATRIGQLRPFAIIDGANTVRILKAYGKLGF